MEVIWEDKYQIIGSNIRFKEGGKLSCLPSLNVAKRS